MSLPAQTLPKLRIDFVSDIACPWCAVGLNALESALRELQGEIDVELHFQPFELNPQMGAAGEGVVTYLGAKYGLTAPQIATNQAQIRARGAEVGFAFGQRNHVWNTFAAHRLLHWAQDNGQPKAAGRALKHALLAAYHGQGLNPADAQVLRDAAAAAGLDVQGAASVIDSDRYTNEVRAAQAQWQAAGIRSVPATVVNQRHLISGGQPVPVFVQALRQIATQEAEAPAQPSAG